MKIEIVYFRSLIHTTGCYDPRDNTILISAVKEDNPLFILSIIFHEFGHIQLHKHLPLQSKYEEWKIENDAWDYAEKCFKTIPKEFYQAKNYSLSKF